MNRGHKLPSPAVEPRPTWLSRCARSLRSVLRTIFFRDEPPSKRRPIILPLPKGRRAPIPVALQDRLSDYPHWLEKIQESLDRVMRDPNGYPNPTERVIWALEDRLGSFVLEAIKAQEAAVATGDMARIAEAQKDLGIVSAARPGQVWLADVELGSFLYKTEAKLRPRCQRVYRGWNRWEEVDLDALPLVPVPERLRDHLRDYPDYIERLQEILTEAAERAALGKPDLSLAVRDLNVRLDTFRREAQKAAGIAGDSTDSDAALLAHARLQAINAALSDQSWSSDVALVAYFAQKEELIAAPAIFHVSPPRLERTTLDDGRRGIDYEYHFQCEGKRIGGVSLEGSEDVIDQHGHRLWEYSIGFTSPSAFTSLSRLKESVASTDDDWSFLVVVAKRLLGATRESSNVDSHRYLIVTSAEALGREGISVPIGVMADGEGRIVLAEAFIPPS
jgi:hypothetical protein